MATLFNTKISATYPALLKTIDNLALTAALKELTDGSGNQSGLYLNTAGDFKVTAVLEWGSLKDTGTGVVITQFVTSTDGIENFDNNTTLPTSAAVKLYVDTKFATTDTLSEVLGFGNTTSGYDISVTTGDDIVFASGSKALFNSQLSIYADGNNSIIKDEGTGELILTSNGAAIKMENSTGEKMIYAVTDGTVELYYDSNKKFETTALGATVSGSLLATGQISSTIATGTSPLVITSTTLVPNLYVARSVLADSATTNANLTGMVTSVGNVTTVVTNADLVGMVTSVGNTTTVVTNANLTGEVTSVGNAATVSNSAVIAKVLTGYSSGAGVVSATDSIIDAVQKVDGNEAANLALINTNTANISSNDTDIANEIVNRTAADDALGVRITNETTARTSADTTLQNNIDAEALARSNADTTLQTNIDAEASTRASEDTTLQANINTEAATRLADDNTLQGNIDTNTASISSNDTDIATNVSSISTINSTAEFLVNKGVANGYVPLDSGAKILEAYLPASIIGQLSYQGVWNANTNTPTLPTATTVQGDYYIVDVAGTYNTIDFNVGDWVISNGVEWQKVDNTDAVTTVFGRLGNVLAVEADYSSYYPTLTGLDSLITANSSVTANTAKVGITTGQANEISANTLKVGYTDALVSANASVAANTAKVGYTESLVSANASVAANTAKVGYTETLVSANASVVANTAKVGITSGQASEITANTAKTGITSGQASEITANTAKVGITTGQASEITANTAKVSNIVQTTVTGNAGTATILQTARTIAGVSFNGSANIALDNSNITNGAGYITSYVDTTYTAGSGLSLVGTEFANTAPNIVQTSVTGNAGTVTNGVYTIGTQTIGGVKTFSSQPKAPTPATSNDSTSVATTAYVKNQGYTSNTGTTTASNTQTFTNKSGSNLQWTNDAGYITSTPGGDITGVTAGDGLSGGGTSGTVTLTNADKGSSQNIFKNIAVSGQSNVVADSNDDTLTFVAAGGMTITTDATTDTVTFNPGSATNNYVTSGSYTSGVLTLNRSGLSAITVTGFPTNNNELTNGAGYITSYVDTTYTAGSGLSLTGTEFANTAPNIVQTSVTGNAGTVTDGVYTTTVQGLITNNTAVLANTAKTSNIVQTTVSGNAGTATILQTARTIAGVSFNGSANISLNNNAITNGAGYVTSSGVTAIGATSPVTSSGGTTPTIGVTTSAVNASSSDLATGAQIQTAINTATTGVLTYKGTWNASTNSPALSSGSGTTGDYYIVSVAGSTNLDGITDWALGDWAVFSDLATDAWQKIDNSQVGSVTGTGVNNRLAIWDGTSAIDSDSGIYTSGSVIYSDGGNASQWNAHTSNTGTVTSVSQTHGGDAFTVGGSPVTSSGTLAVTMAGTSSQYVDGAGNLTTFPSIPQGDITEVIAGSGMSGGGTSGTVTLTNAAPNIVQTTVSGNAGTVTNGVYTSTVQSLITNNTAVLANTAKVSNIVQTTVSGNAGTVTNGVYTTTVQSLITNNTAVLANTAKVSNIVQTTVSGNAGTVTNGVYTIGTQTIGGAKTFSTTPVVGTIATANDSTSAASTAWVKNQGYITSTPGGDITGVTAGTGLSGGGTSGTVTLDIDSTVATLAGAQTFTNKQGDISQWTNDAGYLTSAGDITGVIAGTGMSGGGTTGTVTLTNSAPNIVQTTVTGNAGTVTNGVYTTTVQGLITNNTAVLANTAKTSNIVQTSVSGNAGTVTNGVYTTTVQGLITNNSEVLANTAKTSNIVQTTVSGNAGSATVLQTTRTIAGISFDGSANISLNNNAISNGAGYTTNTGTTTPSNTQTFTNKSGNISQWTNDAGYTTSAGDITGVTAGTNLTGGGTSGTVTLNMATGGVGSGIYGSNAGGTKVDQITVDAYGRVTAITTGPTGSSDLAIGSTASTAKAGNTTTISSAQASAITANTAKTGITSSQASAITANTAKVGITSGQASEITANTAKTGISSGQASAITANTAKVGITSGQASAITANTAKVGITSGQSSAITANTAKVTDSGTPAMLSNGSTPSLNSGISAAEVRSLIGAGTSSNTGTVTSVETSGTVSGITLTGTVTTSGILSLGGTLSLTSANVTGGLGFTPYNATNPSGYTTNTGTTTASNTQTFTNKSGNISQWTNNSGYTTNVGDITGVTAGTNLTGGGTSGSVTLNMATGGAGAATYGSTSNSTKIDTITLDAYGRVTAVATGATGQVNTVATGNSSTLTSSGTTAKTLTPVTATVSSGSAALATGAQIQTAINSATTGVLTYQGTWNASTNSPTLSSGSGTAGYYYIVSVAGSTNLDGETDWAVGDWAVFSDLATDAWQKIDNTQVGNVTGSGSDGRVAFWNEASNITSDTGLTFNDGTKALTVDGSVAWSGGGSGESNSAYDNMVTGFSDSGTSTKTLTLTQQDGGTLTTSFSIPQGDITGITAGSGISGGGTSGTVTITNSSPNIVQTTVSGNAGTVTNGVYTNTVQSLITNNSAVLANTAKTSNIVQTTVSGNAGSATVLQTARNIAGVSFNGSANISLNNNAITNGAGYITSYVNTTYEAGTGLTLVGTEFRNTITNNNQLTNGAGYTTNTGTTTASNTQTFTNKSGNVSQWTNDAGYVTSAGDITGVIAGTGLSGGGTTGTVTLTNSSPNIVQTTVTGNAGTVTNGVYTTTVQSLITNNTAVAANTAKTSNIVQTTVSGNAGSATVLQTARSIAGVSFNGSANISLNNNAITNGAGYTTATGSMSSWILKEGNGVETATVTDGETVTFAQGTGIQSELTSTSSGGTLTITNTSPNIVQTTVTGNAGSATVLQTSRTIAGVSFNGSGNISLNNNAITNGAGFTTNTGTTTASNSQTFTNKGGNISQWTNNSGYTTNVGDITGVTAGTGMSGGGTSGTVTLTNTSPNIVQTTVTGNAGTATALQSSVTIAGVPFDGSSNISLNNNAITNGAGYTTNVGDITGVTAGSGMSGGGTSGTVTLTNSAPNIVQTTVSGNAGTVTNGAYVNVSNNFTQIQKTTLSEPKLQLISNSSPSLTAGLGTQVGGQLLSFGTNYSQGGNRNTSYVGGYFRIDTRTGAESEFFNIQRIPASGSESVIFKVSSTGDVVANGNITAYSDKRLKSDIKTIDNALDKVNALRGVTFTKDGERGLGVIAQEVEKVLPEVVLDGEYKSVAYGNMVGVLIEAVKELTKEVEMLKAKLK